MEDRNVEHVRELLKSRAEVGYKKYGCNTERDDLSVSDWIQHALEEACDLAVYLARMKSDAERNTITISTSNVAVDQAYYWQPMSSCPLGCKVQLLTQNGVAVYGVVNKQQLFLYDGWAALPKRKNT